MPDTVHSLVTKYSQYRTKRGFSYSYRELKRDYMYIQILIITMLMNSYCILCIYIFSIQTSLSTTPTAFQFTASQTPITPHTHPASTAVPSSSIFSFTSPIAVVDKPLPQTTPTSSITKQFQFSRPVVVSGSVQKPNLSDIKSTPVSSGENSMLFN